MSMLRKARPKTAFWNGEEDPRSYDHHCFPSTGYHHYLLGSNAAAVVRHAECSVLVCADTNARTLLRAF